MIIVVDTNILIDFSRKTKKGKERVLWQRLVAIAQREGHQLVYPSIAIFELFAGSEMGINTHRDKMENILRDVLVLDLTRDVAQEAAALFRKYQLNIGPIDYLLAATAIALDGQLATLNQKHFSPIKNLVLFDLSKV